MIFNPLSFITMADTYEQRKIKNYTSDKLIIDTCAVYDLSLIHI